jgi:hypothetical protein
MIRTMRAAYPAVHIHPCCESDIIGSTSTTLYGIDTNLDILVQIATATGALTTVGPLPSRRTAELLIAAIQDVVPLRSCSTRLRRRQDHTACVLKELGRCGAPCDGTQAPGGYAQVVERTQQLLTDPTLLLDPLRARMLTFARSGRFERAQQVRAFLTVRGIGGVLTMAQDRFGQGPNQVASVVDRIQQGAAVDRRVGTVRRQPDRAAAENGNVDVHEPILAVSGTRTTACRPGGRSERSGRCRSGPGSAGPRSPHRSRGLTAAAAGTAAAG